MTQPATSARGEALPRVLYVSQRLPPERLAGQEIFAVALAREMRALHVDARLLSTRFVPGLARRGVIDEVPVRRVPSLLGPLQRPSQLTLTASYVASFGAAFDVVHAHCLSASSLGAILGARLARRPVVVTPSLGGAGGEIEQLRRAGLTRALHEVDRFLAIHDDIERDLVAAGVPGERVLRLGNGVDLKRFRPAHDDEERARARAALQLAAGDRVIVFVGQLIERKNLRLLLGALEEVRRRAPGAKLVLVGEGPERGFAEDQEGVLCLGPRRDVASVLRAADVFALPSRNEAFPIALLEALASGLPAVVTKAAAPRELRLHERAGLVVRPEEGDLAAALVALLLDEEKRARLARGALALASRFSIAALARSHLEIYRSVCRARPPG